MATSRLTFGTTETSGKKSVLEITVEGSRAEFVIIPAGTASIELVGSH